MRRLGHVLKWVCLAAAVATAALWIVSGFRAPAIAYVSPRGSAGINIAAGQVGVVYSPGGGSVWGVPPAPGFHTAIERRRAGFPRWRWQWWWAVGTMASPPLTIGYIPLYLPFAGSIGGFVLLYATLVGLDQRRAHRGRCRCGYDRTGLNRGAPCPECGTPATSPPRS